MDPEALVLDVLSRQLLPAVPPAPTDEWERRLLEAVTDCGVSLSDEALSAWTEHLTTGQRPKPPMQKALPPLPKTKSAPPPLP